MVCTVNTNSMNSSPHNNFDGEWTTIPVKPKLRVAFPRRPKEPTLHMLVLSSYFPMSSNKWIWHCYLDDEILSPNPRGRERQARIQKAFTKSGNFFAERGIVLHSLNVSTSRLVELFFGSEEDLWKADALVEEYSQGMTGVGDRIRRKESTGRMVCHGVSLFEKFAGKFVGRYNLEEERSRELEDMNPVFDSHGKRVLYRIRCVHYMSSQASKEQLMRTGETWAVTFSDLRVAECFIDGYAEFNFFMDPCAGGLKWYQEGPYRFFPGPNGFLRSPGSSNGSGGASGAVGSSGTTTAGANKSVEKSSEGLVLSESPEQAKSTLNVKVGVTEQKRPEDQILTSPLEQAQNSADLKVTTTEQQESQIQPIAAATTGGSKQVVVTGRPEVQMLATATTDGLKQAVIAKKLQAQASTNALTEQATNAAAVKNNATEQQKPQQLQHPAKTTPTSTSIESAGGKATGASYMGEILGPKPKHQPQRDGEHLAPLLPPLPPPCRKPTATKNPSDAPLNKSSPPAHSTLPNQAVKRQYPINPKKPGGRGAKVTPPAKEPTSGNSGSNNNNSIPVAPSSALASHTTTATHATTTRHFHRQHRQPNPRQGVGHEPSNNVAPATTTPASTAGVSAGRGGATTASVDASQYQTGKIPSSEVIEKRKPAARRKTGKKKADKKVAAPGAAGGGEGEVMVEKETAQGVVAG